MNDETTSAATSDPSKEPKRTSVPITSPLCDRKVITYNLSEDAARANRLTMRAAGGTRRRLPCCAYCLERAITRRAARRDHAGEYNDVQDFGSCRCARCVRAGHHGAGANVG